jgi:ATP-dependent Clp protease ATP-binding subunit ClpA/post-segregation antitoxin (ccd killing protein)
MPKINVYLPDDLAETVRETGIPVSAVCQRALEEATRRVTAVRAAVAGHADVAEAVGGLTQFTARARAALTLAIERAHAADAPALTTAHLLAGILAEGSNLALHVLRAVDVDPDRLAAALAEQSTPEATPEGDTGRRLSVPASAVLDLTVAEAISLDHNYVGCEHLLLGLAADPDGAAGAVLRAQGADHRGLRRAVLAAMAGYVHRRTTEAGSAATAQVVDAVRRELAPITARLIRLEEHAGLAGAAS